MVSAERRDTRTISESYVFLREVEKLLVTVLFEDLDRVANRLSPNFPVNLIENAGAMVQGSSLLDVLDRLEVLESTAEALNNTLAIGPARVMGDEVIRELEEAFHLPPR